MMRWFIRIMVLFGILRTIEIAYIWILTGSIRWAFTPWLFLMVEWSK